MSLESATYIADLVSTNPTGADGKAQGDNHIRLMKAVAKATLPNADRAMPLWAAVTDVASAATALIVASGSLKVRITGTTTITAFETASSGTIIDGYFAAALTLTHNASSLILPGGANITTAAGDSFTALSLGSGNWKIINYNRASGEAVVSASTVGTQSAGFFSADMWAPEVTNGAQRVFNSLATNLQIVSGLAFDTTTQEFANLYTKFPKKWNAGTITFKPHWYAASGSGNVVFAMQGVAITHDDPLNGAWGTAQNSDMTMTATNDLQIGPASSAITIAGSPAKDDGVWLRIKRVVASDNLGVDAIFLGAEVFITTDAATDA